jgi:micrococcal nuclease
MAKSSGNNPLPLCAVRRSRFQPRRPLATVAILAFAALVGFRIWQLSADRPPEKLEQDHHQVESVTDGDTLVLAGGARVRLIGVDAPETRFSPRSDGEDQPLARDALTFAEQAVEGRQVRLEFDKERTDKYGRFLAYIWYMDRESGAELLLNEELIRAGLARALLRYPYSESMKRRFREAQWEAKGAKRGVWSDAGGVRSE